MTTPQNRPQADPAATTVATTPATTTPAPAETTAHATPPAGPAKPQTLRDRALAATPVVLTVLATVLAGLSSGEMSRAQYYRALAAQAQAKAGDQWAFYQAKRMRGAAVENTVDLLAESSRPGGFDPTAAARDVAAFVARLKAAGAEPGSALARLADEATALQGELSALLTAPDTARHLAALGTRSFPEVQAKPIANPELRGLVQAIAAQSPEEQTASVMRRLDEADVRQAIRDVEAEAAALDAATGPVNQVAGKIKRVLSRLAELAAQAERQSAAVGAAEVFRADTDFTAARLRYEAARYQVESGANLRVGRLYEASVRHQGFVSDRHRVRSVWFFYAMLCAQAAVTIATIGLATRQQKAFWALAAALGLVALALGGYVYLVV